MKESKALEFKESLTNTYLKTVSAYSNYGSGVIQFGVDDSGRPVGIANPDRACLDIENQINDSVKPKPGYTMSVNQKTKVITLSVSEGMFKPYLYKGKAYKRSDTSTVEVDQIELKRLILEGNNQYFEQLPYQSKTGLTFNVLEEKLVESLKIEKISKDILRTLNLYTDKGGFNNAAGLLADKNSFGGIDIVRYGNNINEIAERVQSINQSVLTQYDVAMSIFKRYYEYEEIEGAKRIKKELLPKEAFREAVANALVHRTWDVNSNIRISMYQDKIEISSPGGLPSGISKEEYLNGSISYLRNPILGNVFFRLHLIEMFGTGIKRIQYSYQLYDTKPGFQIYDNSIVVVLPTMRVTKSVSSDEKKVFDLLSSGQELSSGEIAESVSLSRIKVIRTLNSLLEKGLIKVIGKGRGTKYTKIA